MAWPSMGNVGRTIRIKAPRGKMGIGSTFAYGGLKYKNVGVAGPEHNIHSFGEFAGSESRGRSKKSSWDYGEKGYTSSHINFKDLGGIRTPRYKPMNFRSMNFDFPSAPDEPISARRIGEEPAGQTEEERKEGNRHGDEKILREFDYVRDPVKGKGLVMGIETPPPNQVVIVKLNAGHVFLPFASVNLSLLGHVYQAGHLPDAPT